MNIRLAPWFIFVSEKEQIGHHRYARISTTSSSEPGAVTFRDT
jgi:hypothetical protein